MLTLLTGLALAAPNAWLVIADGATDPAGGQAKLDAYVAAGHPAPAGWPRLVDSATVEGLNPGFHITAVAAAPRQDAADALVAELKARGVGAYARHVAWPDPQPLHLLVIDNLYLEGDSRWHQEVGTPLDTSGVTWSLFVRVPMEADIALPTAAWDREARRLVMAWEGPPAGFIVTPSSVPGASCDQVFTPLEEDSPVARMVSGPITCQPR